MKTIKQTVRNRSRLLIIILSPILFFGFFGYVFTPQESGLVLNIGFINEDTGYSSDYTGIIPNSFSSADRNTLSDMFFDLFENYTITVLPSFNRSNTQLDLISYSDEQTMINNVETNRIDIGIIMPADFTEVILGIYNLNYYSINGVFLQDLPTEVSNTTIRVLGDPSLTDYQTAYSLFSDILNSFTESIYGEEVFSDTEFAGGEIEYNIHNIGSDISEYHYFVGGFLVFLVLLNMINVAGIMAEEKETGTINRIKLSLMPSYKLFIAITVMQILTMTVQLFISAIIIKLQGVDISFIGWINIFIVMQIANVNITGIGLIIASFSRSQKDATSIAGILSSPLGFLSGVFVPLPDVYIVKSIDLQFWAIIPSYHAVTAVQSIIVQGSGITEVISSLIWLSSFSIIWFFIGLKVYNKRVINSDT